MRVHRRIFSALVMIFVLLLSTSLPAAAKSNSLRENSTAAFTGIEFVSNIETIGVAVSGTGLPPTAELSYRQSGEPVWHSGHQLMRIDDGRLIGSLFNLSPATTYDVRVFDGTSEINGSVSTQPDELSFTASLILHVDDNALPGGNGSAAAPFQSIQQAVNQAGAGTQVLVADGMYREAVTFPNSGTEGNWIQVRAAGNAAILDGADRLSGNIWTLSSTSKVWFTHISGPVAYLARDGKRYYQYDDRNGLMQAVGHGGVTIKEGWFYEPSTLRLYVRSLDDPANHTWQLPGLNHAFDLAARNWIWIEGFEMQFYGTTTNGCGVCALNTSHIVIRRNKIHNMQLGIFINWTGTEDQGNDTRIEQNEVYDPLVNEWPWTAVKGSFMEGTGIIIRGHTGAIVRDNHVHNFFNGIYTGSSGALENPELAFDADIYRNTIHHISDDALEPEGACINQRFRTNTVDSSFIGISLAPITQGPTWVLRSTFTNFTGRGIKFANNSDGIVLVYQNTGWTNAANINGADLITSIHNVVMRNNIFQTAAYSFAEVPTGSTANDWNYDNWYTTRGATGPHFKWENVNYNTISALCAASGLECDGHEELPGFTNATGGDFTLLSSSPNIDRGVVLPGINDDFVGNAPDVGAYEFGFDPPPIVSSSVRANANPTDAANVSYTVKFSKSVTGVDISDFALTTASVTAASITSISGSGTTYSITVNTGSGNGTIRLDVVDDNTIIDAAGNPLGGVNVGDGNYAAGQVYTINKIFTSCANQSQIPTTECAALVALYNSTNGASWTNNTDWLETTNPCSWFGITCAGGTHVTGLNLGGNNLIGTIPPELGNLTDLVVLELGYNHLNGSIPFQLGNLTNLSRLSLTANQLSGSIPPQLGSLSNLTVLGLGDNQLTGSIPSQLGNLTNLIGLFLGANQLSGSIPPQLGNLANLTGLYVANNQLSGSIPTEFGNLSQLKWLWLANNQLSGSIPPQFGNLQNIVELELNDNQLTGSIPTELGNLANLTRLMLNHNQLTGFIPTQLGNLTNLTGLFLSNNQLRGSIPTELGDLMQLQYLYLNGNQLTGSIPSQLGNLTNLQWLSLDSNRLSGEFPASIVNLVNLYKLSFDCWITSNNPAVITFIDSLSPGWHNNICPAVSSITRSNPNPTDASIVNFTVTFSESVTGVDTSGPFIDFALATTGVTGPSITDVSGSGAIYTVIVNAGSGGGTIRLDVVDDNTIINAAGNPLGGVNVGDGNYTIGETYTIWGFKNISKWTSSFDLSHGWTVSDFIRTVGDVNNDGRDDLVGFGLDGVYVALSTGSGFGPISKWTGAFDLSHGWTVKDYVRTVGDVNNDARADLVGFGLDGVYVALSTGSGFGPVSKWTSSFDLSHDWTVPEYVRTIGDVNNDGRDDLVGFGLDGVYIALSTGSSFGPISKWTSSFDLSHGWTVSQFVRTVGDVNNDGRADLIGFGLDGVYVALSTGSGFSAISKWTSAFDLSHGWTVQDFVRTVGDVNSDGRVDLVGFGLDGVYVALSNGSGFSAVSRWTNAFDLSHGWTVSQFVRTVGDVNGDGKADLVGFGLDGVYVATVK